MGCGMKTYEDNPFSSLQTAKKDALDNYLLHIILKQTITTKNKII